MTSDVFPLPDEDHELRLAHQLWGRRADLDRRVLEALLGSPQRFRDLKRLVKGTSDTPLTRTLKRLGQAGLIRQGMNLDEPGDPRYYAATRLGVHVVLKAHELAPIEKTLREARDAGLLAWGT